MELKDQVVSLELAQKLKELGITAPSIFGHMLCDYYGETKGWVLVRGTNDLKPTSWVIGDCNSEKQKNSKFAAYTAAELGEMLPSMINGTCLEILKGNIFGDVGSIYCARYYNAGMLVDPEATNDVNMANSLAKMLIYLIEIGIMKA